MSFIFHPKRLFKLLSIGIIISFSLSDINSLNKMIIKRDKTAPMEQESQKVRGI